MGSRIRDEIREGVEHRKGTPVLDARGFAVREANHEKGSYIAEDWNELKKEILLMFPKPAKRMTPAEREAEWIEFLKSRNQIADASQWLETLAYKAQTVVDAGLRGTLQVKQEMLGTLLLNERDTLRRHLTEEKKNFESLSITQMKEQMARALGFDRDIIGFAFAPDEVDARNRVVANERNDDPRLDDLIKQMKRLRIEIINGVNVEENSRRLAVVETVIVQMDPDHWERDEAGHAREKRVVAAAPNVYVAPAGRPAGAVNAPQGVNPAQANRPFRAGPNFRCTVCGRQGHAPADCPDIAPYLNGGIVELQQTVNGFPYVIWGPNAGVLGFRGGRIAIPIHLISPENCVKSRADAAGIRPQVAPAQAPAPKGKVNST